MIVEGDRTELDEILGDPTTVVLLLRGTKDASPAREVHDVFVDDPSVWDPWHRVALITDFCPLSPEEDLWFDNKRSNYYAVLRNAAGDAFKRIAAHGRIKADLYDFGEPDLFKILDALQTTV